MNSDRGISLFVDEIQQLIKFLSLLPFAFGIGVPCPVTKSINIPIDKSKEYCTNVDKIYNTVIKNPSKVQENTEYMMSYNNKKHIIFLVNTPGSFLRTQVIYYINKN